MVRLCCAQREILYFSLQNFDLTVDRLLSGQNNVELKLGVMQLDHMAPRVRCLLLGLAIPGVRPLEPSLFVPFPLFWALRGFQMFQARGTEYQEFRKIGWISTDRYCGTDPYLSV